MPLSHSFRRRSTRLRTLGLIELLLLPIGAACGYDVGESSLDFRPGESDHAFGDAFVTFDEARWPDIRAHWWNPAAHIAAQSRVVETLLGSQPIIDNQIVSPQDYYATIPGGVLLLIPWRDRINIEVSLHIFDDVFGGNDQHEMRFSPYWIYKGFFGGQ